MNRGRGRGIKFYRKWGIVFSMILLMTMSYAYVFVFPNEASVVAEDADIAGEEEVLDTQELLVVADYYVAPYGDDRNPGTEDEPWGTIQYAADQATAGDLVFVRGGVYEEFVRIRTSGSVTEGYITFQAMPDELPIIDGSQLSIGDGNSALISVKDAAYVIIDGFEVRNLTSYSDNEYPAGIRVQRGSSHIHIRNNDVHHIRNVADSGNAHGIHIYGDTIEPMEEIHIVDNDVHNLVLGSSESLTISGNVDGFLIAGNHIYNNNNIGIDIAGFYGACDAPCIDQARNGKITDNVVHHIDSSHNPVYDGHRSAGGIYIDGGANVVIEGNEVFNSNFGIELASENEGKVTSDIIVKNNYIHHNDGAGIIMGGSDPSNGGAFDNIIQANRIINNDALEQGYAQITFQENVQQNQIINNFIYSTSADATMIRLGRASQGSNQNDNYIANNYYSKGSGLNREGWSNDDGGRAILNKNGLQLMSKFMNPTWVQWKSDHIHLENAEDISREK